MLIQPTQKTVRLISGVSGFERRKTKMDITLTVVFEKFPYG